MSNYAAQNAPEVLHLAKQIRQLMAAIVSESLGTQELGGTCIYASILLKQALEKFEKLPTTIRGGAGERAEGYRDEAGQWHGHYWAEVQHPSGTLLLDVTCDQFGGPQIFCAPLNLATNYKPGYQLEVDIDVAAVSHWLDTADDE